ncbi:MAG: dienelactone hydrolase family protein [Actinomycetota bacterium]
MAQQRAEIRESAVVTAGEARLGGDLEIPEQATGVVVFAHGSGSGRFSPRNRSVAEALRERGLGTLLIDLLTEDEEIVDVRTAELRFDIPLLAERVIAAIGWVVERHPDLSIGLFGASTGAAAALVAAASRPDDVRAVVSRGGRPDMAGESLPQVRAPTLLMVGGDDHVVIGLNREAAERLRAPHELEIVPGAGHLFEEPGGLEEVGRLAGDWFGRHL